MLMGMRNHMIINLMSCLKTETEMETVTVKVCMTILIPIQSPKMGLMKHLEWQLNLLHINEQIRDAGICIVGNIDEDGRLDATCEEVSEMCGIPIEIVEKARQIVLKLDPVGCGAIDVRECLFAQLEV